MGHRIFEIELHVPFYALRSYSPPSTEVNNTKARIRRDLSFLINVFLGAKQDVNLYLNEAHISVVLYGTDEKDG